MHPILVAKPEYKNDANPKEVSRTTNQPRRSIHNFLYFQDPISRPPLKRTYRVNSLYSQPQGIKYTAQPQLTNNGSAAAPRPGAD